MLTVEAVAMNGAKMTFPADMPIANNVEEVVELLNELNPSNVKGLQRTRPYDGQAHTDLGQRGRTFIDGLTMRDIRDCYFRAVCLSAGLRDDESDWPDSIYKIDWNDLDPIAVSQNLTCEIERMMGIFPNVPRLLEE